MNCFFVARVTAVVGGTLTKIEKGGILSPGSAAQLSLWVSYGRKV